MITKDIVYTISWTAAHEQVLSFTLNVFTLVLHTRQEFGSANMAKGLKLKNKPEGGDDRVRYYHSKYVNYSRAIAVMWGVLVVCFLIIVLVCLIQPTWLGTDRDAPGRGYFGLWRYYIAYNNQITEYGTFLDFGLIPSAGFQATTVFVGLSVLLAIICILCFFLFICMSAKVVFIICGWILAVTGKDQKNIVIRNNRQIFDSEAKSYFTLITNYLL